jgi:hypothetical protein
MRSHKALCACVVIVALLSFTATAAADPVAPTKNGRWSADWKKCPALPDPAYPYCWIYTDDPSMVADVSYWR